MRILGLCVILFLLFSGRAEAQDSLSFKGQISAWGGGNPDAQLPGWVGGRFIPQLNFAHKLKGESLFKDGLVDFKVSANIYGNSFFNFCDSANFSGKVKPYRVWGRFSSDQFELRLGLQKINFGSASMLRPLMWFDKIDPRDPLQLTDGVWGALARYYFLNNANVWLWALYGNNEPKGWESFKTAKGSAELGGRIQYPLGKGEIALSYHHRYADSRSLSEQNLRFAGIPENRVGLDAKFDYGAGFWFEASYTVMGRNVGIYTNQRFFNFGIDYTFGVGNGLGVQVEQLFASYGEKPFDFSRSILFSLINLDYPVGMFDRVGGIFYIDWKSGALYNFLRWQRDFKLFSLYLTAWANPKKYNIPAQSAGQNIYAGAGGQLMLVYNF